MTDLHRHPAPWFAALGLMPFLLGDYALTVGAYVAIAAIACLGLVLLTGVTGLISFGQAAFVGIGAYATAYLTTTYGLSPWVTLPLALIVTGLAAAAIGAATLHMGGHYLGLATLAWGISVYYLMGNLPWFGSFNGLSGIPPLSLGTFELRSGPALYAVCLAGLGLSLWLIANFLDSRIGRAVRAIRHGAALPESFGANVILLKLVVFVIAACLAGLAGWLYAHVQRFINPTPFGLHTGIEYLFMTVIGGAGSIWGAVIGAVVVTVSKQWLQSLLPALVGTSGNFEIVVFGAAMLLVLHHAREGIWPHLARLLPGRRPAPAAVAALPSTPRAVEAGRALLVVEGAVKRFGGLVAVNGLSFTLREGEILGLLGPNGAGKSTMFNLISGLLPLTAGRIALDGRRIDGRPPRVMVGLGLARSFQHVKLVPAMTLCENVALGAYGQGGCGVCATLLRLNRAEEARVTALALRQLARVGLAEQADEPAERLALGQQRILEIARALAANPRLLLLDEPAAGLRHHEKRALGDLLVQLRREGVTILLVEHDMDFVMRLADRLVVMRFGEKLAEGTAATVRRDPAVLEAYLGAA